MKLNYALYLTYHSLLKLKHLLFLIIAFFYASNAFAIAPTIDTLFSSSSAVNAKLFC